MRMDDLDFMWNGGETRRYHGLRMLMEDTVGHHSYNVCCIILKVRPDASATLLRAALKHDMAEHIVGDMPAPAKRGLPDYRNHEGSADPVTFREVFGRYENDVAKKSGVTLDEDLLPEEAWLLKFADSLDGMRFCLNERLLGNKTPRLRECYYTFRSYVAVLLFGKEVDEMDMHLGTVDLTSYASPACKELFMALKGRWYDADSK